MKKQFILLWWFFAIPALLLACTTLSFSDKQGKVVFARNFDFPVGIGHIEINQRNLLKRAFIAPPEKIFEWVSKYGSVTFNQGGREFPYGGMNEAGLVIEQMWLQEAKYPSPDERFGLTELQWIQYQLDCSATVQEVIDSDTLVRISAYSVATLHFLVADKSGDVATLEYLDGRLVVHRGSSLPHPVLANCTYDHSMEYKQSIESAANRAFSDWTQNSSGRFSKAANLVEAYDGDQPIVDYAFMILDQVKQENTTQWSIVYDLSDFRIYYKTRGFPDRKRLDMKDLDFSCGGPALFLPIETARIEEHPFQVCTYRDNYSLIEKVFMNVEFLRQHITPEMMEGSAHYMESVECVSK